MHLPHPHLPHHLHHKKNQYDLILLFAFIKLVIHLLTNWLGGYGYFRDELYYIACSDHLDMGYVDQPPLSIFLLGVNRYFFGDSLFAIRMLPAIVGSVTVFLTGLMALRLGGGKFAQSVACTASIVSLINLAADSYYSMNSFDMLFWLWGAYLIIRLVSTGDWIYWIYLGFDVGFGLLNKISIAWFAIGFFVALVLTPERRWLKTAFPYLGGLLAVVLFLPFILWNIDNNFAHYEFMRNATLVKYKSIVPMDLIEGQLTLPSPLTLPLWLAGLFFYFYMKEGKKFVALGWIYVTTLIILIANWHSKPEYLGPAYGMLFAGGAVAFELLFKGHKLSWINPTYATILGIGGMALAPAVLAVLPVEKYIAYATILGISPGSSEGKDLDKLPQFYADRFGWEDKVETVAHIYHSLPPEDQERCAIFSDNYGRCSAIDFFGKNYGLPASIGNHNNYWIWGPRNYTGDVVLILGGELWDKESKFEHVQVAGEVASNYCMPYENNLKIYICRGLKVPLKDLWFHLKDYN